MQSFEMIIAILLPVVMSSCESTNTLDDYMTGRCSCANGFTLPYSVVNKTGSTYCMGYTQAGSTGGCRSGTLDACNDIFCSSYSAAGTLVTFIYSPTGYYIYDRLIKVISSAQGRIPQSVWSTSSQKVSLANFWTIANDKTHDYIYYGPNPPSPSSSNVVDAKCQSPPSTSAVHALSAGVGALILLLVA